MLETNQARRVWPAPFAAGAAVTFRSLHDLDGRSTLGHAVTAPETRRSVDPLGHWPGVCAASWLLAERLVGVGR